MDLSFTATSINGIPVRLLAERWSYNNACCDDVLGTIERPDYIVRGHQNTQIAVRKMAGGRYLRVRYEEVGSREGFVISAWVTYDFDETAVIWRSCSLR
ncbi:MAG: hypothetical protein GTO63_01200 [Anaerolineae bacterium]|nr:hypothetical protein [Anaerolineae bacterium]NIN93673.1 hypothetical protein [Anaerolineae bacterium]NIQ76720.1 hypothetical protein [Anaerolineae bacterium]